MISKDHKKHSDLLRPAYGNFCRNEWAVMGTTCEKVQALATDIISALNSRYKTAYVDASHKDKSEASAAISPYIHSLEHENRQEYQFRPMNGFHQRQLLSQADLAIVNGNHHDARAQVLVIDEIKRSSIEKKISRLTNVQLILLADPQTEVFDFIKKAIPEWKKIPVFQMNDRERIIGFFKSQLEQRTPLLNGLVLAGGESRRMGNDKGAMSWHGKEQRYFAADLLGKLCGEVFISCRKEQQAQIDNNYQTIPDSFTGLGPFGAILSAFRFRPDAAWLVIATDLPLLTAETLHYLVAHRNPASIATTFESQFDKMPEPLITVWEPKSYPALLSFLSQGISCPRKVLMNNDITVLQAPDEKVLMNVNTPEEAATAKKIMEEKTNAC